MLQAFIVNTKDFNKNDVEYRKISQKPMYFSNIDQCKECSN